MNSFEEQWIEFANSTIPIAASDGQKSDMKHAFYAGALSLVFLTDKVSLANEEVGALMYQSILLEINKFWESKYGSGKENRKETESKH